MIIWDSFLSPIAMNKRVKPRDDHRVKLCEEAPGCSFVSSAETDGLVD
jgi:hypothetical protein